MTTNAEGYVSIETTDEGGRSILTRAGGASATSVKSLYDAYGRLATVYRAWPNQTAAHSITYTYDAYNRIRSQTLPEEGLTEYRYNPKSQMIGTQTPLLRRDGKVRGYNYDLYGQLSVTGLIAALPADNAGSVSIVAAEETTVLDRTLGSAAFGMPKTKTSLIVTGSTLENTMTYDAYGRAESMSVVDNGKLTGTAGIMPSKQTFTYDLLDNILTNTETYLGSAIAARTHTISAQNLLKAVIITAAGQTVNAVEYSYDEESRIKVKRLHPGPTDWQQVRYQYDSQGNLTSINSPCSSGAASPCLPADGLNMSINKSVASPSVAAAATPSAPAYSPLFNQQIYRATSHPYFTDVPARRDGLISFVKTQIACDIPFDFAYAYSAESGNALIKARFARTDIRPCVQPQYLNVDAYSEYYDYIPGFTGLGNLSRLRRYAPTNPQPDGSGGAAALVDDITFSYTDPARPGRLTSVSEPAAQQALSYQTNPAALAYDVAGNVTSLPSGALAFAYDLSGRPSTVTQAGQVTTNYHTFAQRELGYKLPSGTRVIRYHNTESEGTMPARYYFEEGYVDLRAGKIVYHIKDYLGTPRVTFTDVNGDGVITAVADILSRRTTYAFGMTAFGEQRSVPGLTTYASRDRADFTGHDIVGSGANAVHDAGARQYVAGLGRFLGVDLLASSMPSKSPYAYALNLPNMLTDPTGMVPEAWSETSWGSYSENEGSNDTEAGGPSDIKGVLTSNKSGSKSIDVTLNAKLIGLQTGGKDNDALEKFAKQIALKANSTFSGTYRGPNGENITVSFKMIISLAVSMSDIGSDDHVIAVVDDLGKTLANEDHDPDLVIGGRAQLDGNVMLITQKASVHTTVHEIGHSLGLIHVADNKENLNHLMKLNGGTGFDLWTSERSIFNVFSLTTRHLRNTGGSPMGSGNSRDDLKMLLSTTYAKYNKSKVK